MSAFTDTMYDLTGQVAVVTGGSRGLGREMCLEFARHGASVVIASRKLDACEELAAEIAGDDSMPAGVETLPVACHVGRWDDCTALVAATIERFGRMDVLVNNAGMSPLYPSLGEVSEDLFDKVLGVNLKGPFRLSALAAERMQANGGGRIINVSSIASRQPSAGEVPYALAKAGLDTLTVALAHAFGPTVRVNGILPGTFMTDISKAWDPEHFARLSRSFPLQRGGEPHEIVGAALYLATRASSYTTGSILKVDGGAGWSP